MWVWSLGWEDPLEKEMATHSSILTWRIPWTEEPGRPQSMGLQSQTWLSNWAPMHKLHSIFWGCEFRVFLYINYHSIFHEYCFILICLNYKILRNAHKGTRQSLTLKCSRQGFFFNYSLEYFIKSHNFQFPESENINKTPGSFYQFYWNARSRAWNAALHGMYFCSPHFKWHCQLKEKPWNYICKPAGQFTPNPSHRVIVPAFNLPFPYFYNLLWDCHWLMILCLCF